MAMDNSEIVDALQVALLEATEALPDSSRADPDSAVQQALPAAWANLQEAHSLPALPDGAAQEALVAALQKVPGNDDIPKLERNVSKMLRGVSAAVEASASVEESAGASAGVLDFTGPARSGKPVAGNSLAKEMWGDFDGTYFRVRTGPDYKKNNQKVHSEKAFYQLLTCDLFSSPKPLLRVAPGFVMPKPLVEVGPDCPLPPLFILNCILPQQGPSMFGKGGEGPSTHAVFFFALTPETLAEAQAPNPSPALQLLMKFFAEAPTNEAVRQTFKFICHVDNLKDLRVGGHLEGYNGKPVLVTKSGTVSQEKGRYFEMDMNVHKWNMLARKGYTSMQGRVKNMEVRLACVIQGAANDELPERVIGCARMHKCDFANAPPLF